MRRNASALQDATASRPRARGRPQKRAEQQRAVNTRRAILNAALMEFAQKGFDAASIRVIADKSGFSTRSSPTISVTRTLFGVLLPNTLSIKFVRSGTSSTRPMSECHRLTNCVRSIGLCSSTPSRSRSSITSCARSARRITRD